uniref:Myelin gene regulatory factor C-terminal domain-containing protein n=1 Tax=Pelusios castaneus TaxID=367368 RepID=A0A8C8RDH7_9SAUR
SFYSALTISTFYVLSIEDQDLIETRLLFFVALTDGTASPSVAPNIPIPEVNFCDILPCDRTYCCPIHHTKGKTARYQIMKTKEASKNKWLLERNLMEKPDLGIDWIDTTISSMQILETQQKIDRRYCSKSLQCSTTEPLIIFQCKVTLGNLCASQSRNRNRNRRETIPETTQGCQHIWILPVAWWYDSAYHFRVAAPDLADCSTDPNYAGIFFTDYYFYFYRQCN